MEESVWPRQDVTETEFAYFAANILGNLVIDRAEAGRDGFPSIGESLAHCDVFSRLWKTGTLSIVDHFGLQ